MEHFTHTVESLSAEIYTGTRIAKCGEHVCVLYGTLLLHAVSHRIAEVRLRGGRLYAPSQTGSLISCIFEAVVESYCLQQDLRLLFNLRQFTHAPSLYKSLQFCSTYIETHQWLPIVLVAVVAIIFGIVALKMEERLVAIPCTCLIGKNGFFSPGKRVRLTASHAYECVP